MPSSLVWTLNYRIPAQNPIHCVSITILGTGCHHAHLVTCQRLLELYSERLDHTKVHEAALTSALARLEAKDDFSFEDSACLQAWKEYYLALQAHISFVDKFLPKIDERIQQEGGVFDKAFKEKVDEIKREELNLVASHRKLLDKMDLVYPDSRIKYY